MISSLLVNYLYNQDIDLVQFSGEIVNAFTQKVCFYNPCVDEPLQKFWYHIPKAKLIKKTQNTIVIVLSNNDKELLKSIENLDKKSAEILYS
ncbi:MAG: hypothetical protein Dasosvirus19_3, partial [Dasosvirus sp.]